MQIDNNYALSNSGWQLKIVKHLFISMGKCVNNILFGKSALNGAGLINDHTIEETCKLNDGGSHMGLVR